LHFLTISGSSLVYDDLVGGLPELEFSAHSFGTGAANRYVVDLAISGKSI